MGCPKTSAGVVLKHRYARAGFRQFLYLFAPGSLIYSSQLQESNNLMKDNDLALSGCAVLPVGPGLCRAALCEFG